MLDFFRELLDTHDFPARWYCGNWDASLGWLHILSDFSVFAAYTTIPLLIVYFVRKRADLPFSRVFWLFGAFIMACGLTHLVEATIFWHPVYRLSGLMKAITALISWITVVTLWRRMPALLELPGLAAMNERLTVEIAERKKAEAEILAAKRDLEAKNRELEVERARAEAATLAKSSFLANMSHEIRTPINGVIGMTSWLLETEMGDDQKEIAQSVKASGDALLTVINDILDFSKIEAGRLDLERLPFHLERCLREVESIIGIRVSSAGLDFDLEIDPLLPVALLGDSGRIRQILLNLASNAVKFTEEGGILIRVSQVGGSPTCPRLRFEVEDSGIGIPADRVDSVFESFTQADASTTRKYGGTGLGLSVCKQLVELMGGVIGARSQVGGGSVFWFEIELEKASSADIEAMENPEPPSVSASETDRSLRVLVAEDNVVNQKVAVWQLTRLGHSAETVANGLEAVEATQRIPYDVILMDCIMPKMDGYEATRRIREQPGGDQIRIIAMTASAMSGDRERCIEAGMDDYLGKPVDFQELQRALGQARLSA